MKHRLFGWQKVYSFTISQSLKGKGYKLTTTLFALLIIAILVLINIVKAIPEEKPEESTITTVYVADESGFTKTDYAAYINATENETMDEIQFITTQEDVSDQELVLTAGESFTAIAVLIKQDGTNYTVSAFIPENSSCSYSDVEALTGVMCAAFETNKLTQVGLSMEQLTVALTPVVVTYAEIGEDTGFVTVLVKMLAPMLFGLMLYFMLLFYGQTICKEVSTEKTSKLIETLLLSVHPYALITGKVLAIASMAIMQFVIWILSAVVGLYGGNAIAGLIFPEYQNSVVQMLDVLRDNIGTSSAMTLPAVILGVVVFCIGFIFFCVLAGLAGSMVTTPESAATVQGVFQFPVIISWLVSYFASFSGSNLVPILRYIPFTTPFCVPVDVITGQITLLEGAIAGLILLLFSAVVIYLSAKIFKGLLLYNGQKVSLKTLGNILKAG